eukprot:4595540-Lingulodinium_polyedra.AAC.1
MPPSSLSLAAAAQVHKAGLVQIRSAVAETAAALARAARKTLAWRTNWGLMLAAAEDSVPLARIVRGMPW